MLHGYTEPSVNDAMDIAMRMIIEDCRRPNSPVINERDRYFDAMKTIQSRTEEFFSQYENGNEELRLSGLADSDSTIKSKAAPKAAQQDQLPQTQHHQPTECKYFPRKHHITGKRIGWTKSRIVWQYEKYLSEEHVRIFATAPQALLKGRTKQDIEVHVWSVLYNLYTAATRATIESEPPTLNLVPCYRWINEKIYLRQARWMSLISHHLDYLVGKLKAETQIEEEKGKFLQKFNSDWEEELKSFTHLEAYDWVRTHKPTADDGAEAYIKFAQDEVAKLLESAKSHLTYVKSCHEEDEASCQWEFELDALYSELQRRAKVFMAEVKKRLRKK